MKILAVASIGGHWIQLLRLRPSFDDAVVEYMSTNKSLETFVQGHKFHVVPDANRNEKLALIRLFFTVFKIVKRVKPDVIITTGAAPGLMAIIAGRLLGSKTIWIDSIACVEHLSLSGLIALKFANKVYTQWPDLAGSGAVYDGNILS